MRSFFKGLNQSILKPVLLASASIGQWIIVCVCVCARAHERALSCFSSVQLFMTLWTAAHQTPLSMGFSRQEYWTGLPRPPPGDLPDPGTKPASLKSPALAGRFFTTSATWKVPLVIREIQIRNTLSCHFIPIKMSIIKNKNKNKNKYW